jgi:hypothetical protein
MMRAGKWEKSGDKDCQKQFHFEIKKITFL